MVRGRRGTDGVFARGLRSRAQHGDPAGRARSRGDGVCNEYGQTHDVANLFISDGSQFSSAGTENPTLTIVALSLRQADYNSKQQWGEALRAQSQARGRPRPGEAPLRRPPLAGG
ncbi:MAG: GMC oxidoreductase [Myxococcaceae bacterium]